MTAHKKPVKPPAPKASFPVLPVLFFGVLICFGVVLWFNQPEPFPTRVTENQRVEDALGWDSDLIIDKKTNAPAKIRFMLRDKNHAPVIGATVIISFSHAGKLLSTGLNMDEPGVYRNIMDVPKGPWQARVNVQVGDYTFQTGKDVNLP